MTKLNIDVPEGFYNDEDRGGYIISSKMKKVWAVELDLLKEFERVCTKYNIKYSAFSGTMLGAVRHKGFIPWDDDIDIIMTRNDYDILLEHSDEFKHPYFLQTPYSDKGYYIPVVKLRNVETTGIVWFDRYARFKQGIFIDIFVLDDIPENWLARVIKKIRIRLLGGYIYGNFYINVGLQLLLKCRLATPMINRLLYRRFNSICRGKRKPSGRMTIYLYYSGYKRNVFSKDSFNNIQDVPFEWTTIKMIPLEDCEKVLELAYGKNWKTPIQAPTEHGKTWFDAEIPYQEFIKSGLCK